MRTSSLSLLCLLLGCWPAASAQDIYKCTAGESVAYQSAPCAAGHAEVKLFVGPRLPRAAEPAAHAATPMEQATPRRPGPWRNRTLVLGMSDDEVLNMPAWGRPARIVRTRLARGWQEVWTYDRPAAEERELRFVNARLADITQTPAQVAQLTLQ
jgi:hypothetical protein